MMQNYSKNPKPARNETKFNNTKKWRNRLDYTTFLIDSYFYLSLFLENYLTFTKKASCKLIEPFFLKTSMSEVYSISRKYAI